MDELRRIADAHGVNPVVQAQLDLLTDVIAGLLAKVNGTSQLEEGSKLREDMAEFCVQRLENLQAGQELPPLGAPLGPYLARD